jgi:hypothetical protein
MKAQRFLLSLAFVISTILLNFKIGHAGTCIPSGVYHDGDGGLGKIGSGLIY